MRSINNYVQQITSLTIQRKMGKLGSVMVYCMDKLHFVFNFSLQILTNQCMCMCYNICKDVEDLHIAISANCCTVWVYTLHITW